MLVPTELYPCLKDAPLAPGKAPRWDDNAPWCAPEDGVGHVAPFAEDVALDTYPKRLTDGSFFIRFRIPMHSYVLL